MVNQSQTTSDLSETPTVEARPKSCVPCFDALWFCYSPVHQFKQYYRVGNVDDCLAYWNDLWDCLKQRTKYRDPIATDGTGPLHPVYTLRTPEEAQRFWKAEFGHLQAERDAEENDRLPSASLRVPEAT